MADTVRSELDTPSVGQRRSLITIDADKIGAFAEKVARFFGTGEYLFWQTVFVIAWVALNIAGFSWQWDPYPFIPAQPSVFDPGCLCCPVDSSGSKPSGGP